MTSICGAKQPISAGLPFFNRQWDSCRSFGCKESGPSREQSCALQGQPGEGRARLSPRILAKACKSRISSGDRLRLSRGAAIGALSIVCAPPSLTASRTGHAIPNSISRLEAFAINARLLVRDLDWPPRAVTMRVLDAEGRDVSSEVRDTGLCPKMAAPFVFDYFGALNLPPSPSAPTSPRVDRLRAGLF